MKYPRLSEGQDKRRKLSLKDIKDIQRPRACGKSLRKIAGIYDVSKAIIFYHTALEEKRAEINKARYGLIKDQIASDPDFAEQRRKYRIQQKQDVLQRSPKHREYQNFMIAKSQKARAEQR